MSATFFHSREMIVPDVTGWPLEEARKALIGHELTIVETVPPRASGPLGDWRVLRCRVSSNSETRCEILIAREQLPKPEPAAPRSDS